MCIPDICPCSDSLDICLCCLPMNLLCCCLPCCQRSEPRERVVYVPVSQPIYDQGYVIRQPVGRF